MISPLVWFLVVYVSIGLFIMMEGLVLTWRTSHYPKWLVVVGSTVAVLVWPAIFFMD
jgi:hypothetical protein